MIHKQDMLLKDFLDEFEKDPEIAKRLPAARRELHMAMGGADMLEKVIAYLKQLEQTSPNWSIIHSIRNNLENGAYLS